MSWINYSIVLIAYYALHSIMASSAVKFVSKNIGINEQLYRILFNVIALVTTYVVFICFRETPNTLNFAGSPIGFILVIAGVFLVLKSLINYDLLAFIGLTKENHSDELIISGLNSRLRHPLYLGILIGLVGWIIVQPTSAVVVTYIVTLIYVQFGIYFEEKKLIAQFGEQYKSYKQSVPKLIPRIK